MRDGLTLSRAIPRSGSCQLGRGRVRVSAWQTVVVWAFRVLRYWWWQAANLGWSAGRRLMGEMLVDSWSPDFRPRMWERDKEQFSAWMAGADVRGPWKRRRFGIWREEQFSSQMRVAREAEQKRQAELMANPSAELVEAYRELQAAEAASGARIGCARGGDMTDPKTVRALARLLSDHAEKFQ